MKALRKEEREADEPSESEDDDGLMEDERDWKSDSDDVTS